MKNLLKSKIMAVLMLLVVFAVPTMVNAADEPYEGYQNIGAFQQVNISPSFVADVLALTNQERASYGLAALLWCNELANAAARHSEDMAVNMLTNISHTSSDGTTFESRFSAAVGHMYTMGAENIAAGQTTPEEVVRMWMLSPSHRVNMLNPDFTHMGVGLHFVEGHHFQTYWTQIFGGGNAASAQVPTPAPVQPPVVEEPEQQEPEQQEPEQEEPEEEVTTPPTEENEPEMTQQRNAAQWHVPIATESGVLLSWLAIEGNELGYRLFRATSSDSEGVPVNDAVIMANPNWDESRIKTFDPNVSAGNVYYYYVREVLYHDNFDEVLGNPSTRLRVATLENENSGNISTHNMGFIMMMIDNPIMNVNNAWQNIDPSGEVSPVIRQDRTKLPIRAVVEAISNNAPNAVSWYEPERRVDLTAQGNNVSMWINRTDALVNGTEQEMDTAPSIENGRTLLPLRFAAEFLGTKAEWIGSDRLAIIVYTLPLQ